jgi:hypothetical protein
MTKSWPEIVATDLAARRLGTVLMLGPGGEALLGSLPLAATTRVIRAEPDPRRARALQRQHASDASVTILPVAIAETAGPAKLRRFNLSHATSFRAPTGLKTLFPGLCETGQVQVETQTVAAVVQEVDLDREADNVLILGLAGEELSAIGQLAKLGLLQRFTHVIVPLPRLPLYEGAGSGQEIRIRLEEAGFKVESRDMSDPDLAFAHLRLNPVQMALATERDRLHEELKRAQTEIERLASERDEVASARDAVRQKAASQEEEITRLQDAVGAIEAEREAAQKMVAATQQEKDRIGILSDTYRHAIRLELTRASERARPLSPAVLRWLEALDSPTSALTSQSLGAQTFNLEVYRKTTEAAAAHADRHIILDVKSIPRSGLHFMKRQFAHLFQDRFSFCEWYQEPGCCKRMPCAFFPHAADGGAALRMLKSHDFDLKDPVYPVTPGLQRLILVRDPLYVLTSHWLLHLLAKNKDILAANDIRFEKIVYLHEPAVLSRAYALLDEAAVIPDAEAVATFLSEQREYLTGFARKWAVAAQMPRTYVVPYEKTPLAIEACLAPIREAMSAEQRARLDDYTARGRKSFQPRQDPFKGPTPYLSSLLEQHSKLFRSAADAVRDAGGKGFLDLSE